MDYSKSLILHWNGKTWKQAHSPSPAGRTSLTLRSVTVTSARNAWAAGYSNGKTLIERWNGITWKQVPSPSPASDSYLFGVAAASAPQRLGGRRHLPQRPLQDADHALERHKAAST